MYLSTKKFTKKNGSEKGGPVIYEHSYRRTTSVSVQRNAARVAVYVIGEDHHALHKAPKMP